jgi:hypothetical protein
MMAPCPCKSCAPYTDDEGAEVAGGGEGLQQYSVSWNIMHVYTKRRSEVTPGHACCGRTEMRAHCSASPMAMDTVVAAKPKTMQHALRECSKTAFCP